MTTNGCEGCFAYKVQKGIIEADICDNCGKQEIVWRQNKEGFLYLECTNCHETIAVDLNTPCELDPVFIKRLS